MKDDFLGAPNLCITFEGHKKELRIHHIPQYLRVQYFLLFYDFAFSSYIRLDRQQ
jgi:hypothetical protein